MVLLESPDGSMRVGLQEMEGRNLRLRGFKAFPWEDVMQNQEQHNIGARVFTNIAKTMYRRLRRG